MRTTIDLPDQVLRQAKATAALQGRPLRALIEEAVREKLARIERGADERSETGWRSVFGHATAEEVAEVDAALADFPFGTNPVSTGRTRGSLDHDRPERP